MVDRKASLNRRSFLELSGATVAAVSATPAFGTEFVTRQVHPRAACSAGRGPAGAAGPVPLLRRRLRHPDPGRERRIVGMVPDKLHPTNKGVQCIKGLNAHEPIYRTG